MQRLCLQGRSCTKALGWTEILVVSCSTQYSWMRFHLMEIIHLTNPKHWKYRLLLTFLLVVFFYSWSDSSEHFSRKFMHITDYFLRINMWQWNYLINAVTFRFYIPISLGICTAMYYILVLNIKACIFLPWLNRTKEVEKNRKKEEKH